MTILMLWWILTLLGLLISDGATGSMIVSRLTPIDCEKYVYHPQCRGLQAKKRLSLEEERNMVDGDGNDMIVDDDEKPNICVCNYKRTNWMASMRKKRNLDKFGRFGRNRALKLRTDVNVKERRLVMRNGILNNDDIKKELDERKKLTVTVWKQKKKKDFICGLYICIHANN